VDAWCGRERLSRGDVMTLDRCWDLARRWYAGRTEPEWRGRPAQASQAIFAEVGLTGDFWRMA